MTFIASTPMAARFAPLLITLIALLSACGPAYRLGSRPPAAREAARASISARASTGQHPAPLAPFNRRGRA